jgi:hypothetical protein
MCSLFVAWISSLQGQSQYSYSHTSNGHRTTTKEYPDPSVDRELPEDVLAVAEADSAAVVVPVAAGVITGVVLGSEAPDDCENPLELEVPPHVGLSVAINRPAGITVPVPAAHHLLAQLL